MQGKRVNSHQRAMVCVVRGEGHTVESHLEGIAVAFFSIETNQQQLHDSHSRAHTHVRARRLQVQHSNPNQLQRPPYINSMPQYVGSRMNNDAIEIAKQNAGSRRCRHLCSVLNVKYDAKARVSAVCRTSTPLPVQRSENRRRR